MTPTPVGMRCPACSRQRTRVKTVRSLPAGPSATMVLIAINVIVFVAEFLTGGQLVSGSTGVVGQRWRSVRPSDHPPDQYWRLVTSGFLHDGLLHILFNMIFLWIIGPQLEQALDA